MGYTHGRFGPMKLNFGSFSSVWSDRVYKALHYLEVNGGSNWSDCRTDRVKGAHGCVHTDALRFTCTAV